MIFVDPHAEEGAKQSALRLPAGVTYAKLFKAWGIKFDRDKVLGDLKAGQRVQAGGLFGRRSSRVT